MKIETAALLKKHLDDKKFSVTTEGTDIKFDYELTDEEVQTLVETEYGKTLLSPVPELFRLIVIELLKMGIEHAKKPSNTDSGLSNL